MPSQLEVVVGEDAVVRVDVEKQREAKPYLGGYRHQKTGRHYHHASSQSDELGLIRPPRSVENLRNRDTQTYETKTRSTQNVREYGTQMKRADLDLDEAGDREVTSKKYFTSEQQLHLKKQKAQALQRYWRGFVARRRTWTIRQRLYERQQAEERALEEKAKAEAARKQFEIERRVNPRTRRDFELLYNELESWRSAEVERVANSPDLTPEARKQLMNDLLAKETKALQTIDQLKQRAVKQGRSKRVDRVMNLMAQPKKWQVGDGEIKEVHTPYTTRAQELRDIYRALTDGPFAMDARLQMLLNVKWTVQEFSCPLTHDIVTLCDREADLLARGRPEKALDGLRRRISNLFLQFIETPDFNPEAARFLKVPNLRRPNATLAQ